MVITEGIYILPKCSIWDNGELELKLLTLKLCVFSSVTKKPLGIKCPKGICASENMPQVRITVVYASLVSILCLEIQYIPPLCSASLESLPIASSLQGSQDAV